MHYLPVFLEWVLVVLRKYDVPASVGVVLVICTNFCFHSAAFVRQILTGDEIGARFQSLRLTTSVFQWMADSLKNTPCRTGHFGSRETTHPGGLGACRRYHVPGNRHRCRLTRLRGRDCHACCCDCIEALRFQCQDRNSDKHKIACSELSLLEE